jgi:uncharacterized damage-inducible protein DinB
VTEEVVGPLFLKFSSTRLQQLSHRVSNCLARLSDKQVWARNGENENSVANVVLHVSGNVSEWILASIGGEQSNRRREVEFTARDGFSGKQLSGQLSATVMRAMAVIDTVNSRRLSERVVIQKHNVSVFEAIYHVVEHFSMHAGQIILITKMLTGEALAFEHDLEGVAPDARGTQNPAGSLEPLRKETT